MAHATGITRPRAALFYPSRTVTKTSSQGSKAFKDLPSTFPCPYSHSGPSLGVLFISMASRLAPCTQSRRNRQRSATQPRSLPSLGGSSTRGNTHGVQGLSEPIATFSTCPPVQGEQSDHAQLSDASMEDGEEGAPSNPPRPPAQLTTSTNLGKKFRGNLER